MPLYINLASPRFNNFHPSVQQNVGITRQQILNQILRGLLQSLSYQRQQQMPHAPRQAIPVQPKAAQIPPFLFNNNIAAPKPAQNQKVQVANPLHKAQAPQAAAQPAAKASSPFEQAKINAVGKIFKDAVGLGMRKVSQEAIKREVNNLTPGKTHTFSLNGLLYAVSNAENSSVVKVARKALTPFKQGAFGEIYPMIDLDNPNDKANILKLAKDNPIARADVVREQQILNYLHGGSNQLVAGIQKAPHKIVAIGQPNGNNKVGYMAARYEMDGADLGKAVKRADPFTPQQKSKMIAEATSGLDHVHKKGVYHGDIKPQNMLFGAGKLVLSDFGGARKFSEIFQGGRIPSMGELLGAHTPAYLSKALSNEMAQLTNLYHQRMRLGNGAGGQQILQEFQSKATELLKRNDKFALGMSLYQTWTKKDPSFFYSNAPFNHPAQLQSAVRDLWGANLSRESKLTILDHLIEGATANVRELYRANRNKLFA